MVIVPSSGSLQSALTGSALGGEVAAFSLAISGSVSSNPKRSRSSLMCCCLLLFGMTGLPCCTSHLNDTCAPDTLCAFPIEVTRGPSTSSLSAPAPQGP